MTDRDLPELLDRLGERVQVGPPPIDDMVGHATRTRRRRTAAVVAGGAATVALVLVVGSQLATTGTPQRPGPTEPVASPSTGEVPAGMRLVGIGHAAIAVPDDWGTNQTRCGTPVRDTVVIDVGAVESCGLIHIPAVDSVWIQEGGTWNQFGADEELEIDGVPAERQVTTCSALGDGGQQLCSGTVHVPAEDVYFLASSTSRDEVDRILARIRIVPDGIGVPGFQEISMNQQGGAQEKYVARLEALGLDPVVRPRFVPAVDPGFVLEAVPVPGTMLAPGATVTVTVVAEPRGPADEVSIGMNSEDATGEFHDLTDEQIRAGATIRLGVGDRIWAYAHGRRSSTLAGTLDGTSLAVDDWTDGPNYPHSWQAVEPGRTTITLTITADGAPVTLGTVTVVVGQ